MTRVGVLGATGRVGRAALRHLLADPRISVQAGSRDRGRAEAALPPECDGRAAAASVDLFDPVALRAFCREVDLVVNCAGPSGVVLDRVIEAAVDNGRPVVDPGGYDPVLARLDANADRLNAAGVPVVVGAGLLPGLSGLYPHWLVRQHRGAPRHLQLFYAGTDDWGPASTWDIVHSLGDFGAERPPSRLIGGVVTPVPWRRAFRTVTLPPPLGRVTGMLVHTEELARLAARLNVPDVDCHGVNNGFWSGLVLGVVKLARLHRTPAQIDRSARWLGWAGARDRRRGQAPCFAIDCVATWADGTVRHGRLVVGDTYEATGAIAALVARSIVDGRAEKGVRMMHEATEPGAFLDLFRATGCILMEEVRPC